MIGGPTETPGDDLPASTPLPLHPGGRHAGPAWSERLLMGQQQHSDVIIALRRQLNGKDAQGRDQWIRHGDLIPQATNWDRIMHATERGDFLRLTPAACEAICEAAGITDRLRSLEARIKELSKK